MWPTTSAAHLGKISDYMIKTNGLKRIYVESTDGINSVRIVACDEKKNERIEEGCFRTLRVAVLERDEFEINLTMRDV